MNATIRQLIATHAGLPMPVEDLPDEADLYRAGMKSFASVELMLGLEDAFAIEFPDELLTRATFRSIAAIERAIGNLTRGAMAA